MTKTYEQILESVQELVEEQVTGCDMFRAPELGLDMRAAHELLVDDDRTFIAVSLEQDRTLQYYGGFEYVEKTLRFEAGGYVFYSGEDDRVAEHLGHLNPQPEEEEGSICPNCNGSGEGMYDGSTCSQCKGRGEV